MRIEIATLFPDMVMAVLGESITGRAIAAGKIDIRCRDIRAYTLDKHRRVDDYPYGGGSGMVMQAQPIFSCFEAVCEELGHRPHAVYMSPQGRVLTQQVCREYAHRESLFVLCGHYEGVDQRVLDEIIDEEISIGDFVLTGGEIAAMAFVDAVARLCPGVLSGEDSFTQESHWNGLLEHPQYTRPPEWRGREVPEMLFTGHHKNIEQYRREESIKTTLQKRPDMLERAELTEKERQWVETLKKGEE